jgi:hypothetical protein
LWEAGVVSSTNGRRGLLAGVVAAVVTATGFVADLLGIRSALFPPDTTPGTQPPPGATVVVTSGNPVVEAEPPPNRTPAGSCLVGTWILTARTMDEIVTGVGTVRMRFVQGGETRQFRSDGTIAVQGDFVLEGQAPNGDILARRPVGSGTGRYAVSGSTVTLTDFTSNGTTYYFVNRMPTNQQAGGVYGDGTFSFACSATTLSVQASNLASSYRRQ